MKHTPDETFVGSGKLRSEDAKLKKLQKENEYLKLENEILKKLQHIMRILCGTRSEQVKITKKLFPKKKVSIVCRMFEVSLEQLLPKKRAVKEECLF